MITCLKASEALVRQWSLALQFLSFSAWDGEGPLVPWRLLALGFEPKLWSHSFPCCDGCIILAWYETRRGKSSFPNQMETKHLGRICKQKLNKNRKHLFPGGLARTNQLFHVWHCTWNVGEEEIKSKHHQESQPHPWPLHLKTPHCELGLSARVCTHALTHIY